mmetsp:Transcript_100274/g.279318  ORF Transcript_100274/g.279318 Transcript_100274/m.279318 type:complete len:244 (+) Transcript_100274:2-733(+)
MCSSKSSSSTLFFNWPLVFWAFSTIAATEASVTLAPKASMATGFGSTTASAASRSRPSTSTDDFAVREQVLMAGIAREKLSTTPFVCDRYCTIASLKPWRSSSPVLRRTRTCGSLEISPMASLSLALASLQNSLIASHILPLAISSSMSKQFCARVRVTPCKALTSLACIIVGARKAPARIASMVVESPMTPPWARDSVLSKGSSRALATICSTRSPRPLAKTRPAERKAKNASLTPVIEAEK